MAEISEFSAAVIFWIRKVPLGTVASYGQIARLAGKPQGARGVAWILNSSSKAYELPWQRIVGSAGRISFPVGTAEFKKQKKLLEAEGVAVAANGLIDLKVYQWKKVASRKKSARADRPRMFSGS